MKKSFVIILFVFILIFQSFSFITAYLLFEPFPNIKTDKYEYYPDENISVQASWNIYSSGSEDTRITIFIIDLDPETTTPSWVLNNSLYEINCPFENGENIFLTSIQSSIFYQNCSQFPFKLWVLLMIYNMEGEILINDDVFWNWTEISLGKYNPILSYNISDQINLEFKENYLINNSIIAQENFTKCYANGTIFATLYSGSSIISRKEFNVSVFGEFLFNLNDFKINFTGIYNLSLNISENDLFFSKNFFYIFNITEKLIQIITTNNFSYIFNPTIDLFSMKNKFVDKNNISLELDDPLWNINSNLNKTDLVFMNNFYIITFDYPKNPGSFFINISVTIQNYKFNSLHYNVKFKEFPIADFFSSSNLIIAGETVDFYYSGTEYNGNLFFQWDFGDGSKLENVQNPKHEYNISGNFTVNLRIYDSDGNYINVKKENYIEVIDDIVPVANFSIKAHNLLKNEELHFFFTGTVGNGIVRYIWDFGDKVGFSYEKNPIYTYKIPGNYIIRLKIIDLDGDTSFIFQNIQILDHLIIQQLDKTSYLKFIYGIIFLYFLSAIIIVYSRFKVKKRNIKIPIKSLKI